MKRSILTAAIGCLLLYRQADAGIVVHEDGDKYVKIGGRIQFQYHLEKPDIGSSSDETIFRRLRPYLEGSAHRDWKGRIQFDLGKAEDGKELDIKDAYMQYTGFDNMTLSLGNAEFPFSRNILTSSKRRQLVEISFVGDHNYGTPDRNAGVHLKGHSNDQKISWGASVAQAAVDPDDDKLDFDTPVNRNDDFNEGFMVGGRIDFHPLGRLRFSQGDFSGKTRATIGIAAFTWNNDDDNNQAVMGKADVDAVTGIEISGAFRGGGLSIDIEANSFEADTVNPSITSGIYINGTTTLKNASIVGGYMLSGNTFELVLARESQNADGYADAWNRTSAGINWFLHKHDIKVQFTYRTGENVQGAPGKDLDEFFLQTQYVF